MDDREKQSSDRDKQPSDRDNMPADLEHQMGGVEAEEVPYTVYSKTEKYWFAIPIGLNAILSVSSNSLFFPVIPNIQDDFDVSTELANLSVVVYLIAQSISPMFVGGSSDRFGRKPVLYVMLTCYVAICAGASQIRTYWLLVFIRFLQAISIASTVSIAFGTVSDISPREERGSYGGLISGVMLSGQAFGGLVGGSIASRWGWPGVFVLSAIAGGLALVCCILILPETNRTIVGNQSIPLNKWYFKLFLTLLPRFKSRYVNNTNTILPRKNVNIITSAAKIYFKKKVFFTILPPSLLFGSWTVTMAGISTILTDNYGFDEIKVGIVYLSPGIGSISASLIGGRFLNWNYRRRKAQFEERNDPNEQFNVIKVRSEYTSVLILIYAGATIVFGWCLDKKTNLAPIIIAHFILSFTVVWYLNISQTVLIDLYPTQSSALSSCLNLLRGLISAIFVAAQDKMMESLTLGGCFTLLVGLTVISYIIFRVMTFYESKGNKHSPEK